MQPIVTDQVVWSVCHTSEPCKNGWTDRAAVLDVHSGGPREALLDVGADPCVKGQLLDVGADPCVKGQFWEEEVAGPGHASTCLAVDILKVTQQGAAPVQCRCRFGRLHGAHFGTTWQIRLNWPRGCSSVFSCRETRPSLAMKTE